MVTREQSEQRADLHTIEQAVERQTVVVEEIRDQFAEHLELLRSILRVLMAERR